MNPYRQWTCANKRRRRAVQPHLGDVYGDPMPMVKHRREPRPPRWIENGSSVVIGVVAAVTFAALMIAFVVLLFIYAAAAAKPALAHGPAEWIQRGAYKNAAGELCCGERDCFELADGDVKITSRGYYIVSIKETVPFAEATPSPDGKYWRCQWGGQRKCFFAPPPAT